MLQLLLESIKRQIEQSFVTFVKKRIAQKRIARKSAAPDQTLGRLNETAP